MNRTVTTKIAALTSVGSVRNQNEDAVVVGDWIGTGTIETPTERIWEVGEPLVCLVADGMGGHAAGGLASSYVAARASVLLRNATSQEAIEEALARVNRELYTKMAGAPSTSGMGTTLAGIIVATDRVWFFNVGDSRVYREQEGLLRLLTVDDTPAVVGTPGSGPPSAHVLTQAFGGATTFQPIRPHVGSEPTFTGRRYLICSDGLSALVDLGLMEACLEADNRGSVEALKAAAIDAGGTDNISIVLIRIDGSLGPSPIATTEM